MNLEEYKDFMNVSENPTDCAEDGELQIFEVNRLNPQILDWRGVKIAIDAMHDTLLIVNQFDEIVQIYKDVFGETPEDSALKAFLKKQRH